MTVTYLTFLETPAALERNVQETIAELVANKVAMTELARTGSALVGVRSVREFRV